jgi:putative ABC transport system ATP-binding protein
MLVIDNIFHSYGTEDAVLDGVSLELEQGDFCMLLGANGSGKTTLFNIVSGAVVPDRGRISLNQSKPSFSEIACIVQDTHQGCIKEMTLLENLTLSFLKKDRSRLGFYRQHRKEIEDFIDSFGFELSAYIDQPLSVLSGGQLQQVLMLMAMISEPQLLLLDEHTSALDPKMQMIMMKTTALEVSKRKITCMMITHQLSDALAFGNRLVVLHQGKKVLDLDADQKSMLCLKSFNRLYSDCTKVEEKNVF